jgi:glycosyltransferase involved in cell wall biosynthesis
MDDEKAFDISVIIPVFDGEAFLAEAMESVLRQTFKSFEIIVVDDGSTDRSSQIVKKHGPRVRYIYQDNQGTAAARNRGVEAASGNYLAFLDQDDVWLAHKLAVQSNRMKADDGLDMSFGLVKQRYENKASSKYGGEVIYKGYSPSTLLIKRESLEDVGLFETRWRLGEWANWYIRALEKKLKHFMVEEVVAIRRIHRRNKGILYQSNLREYAEILKESLDRKRKMNTWNDSRDE